MYIVARCECGTTPKSSDNPLGICSYCRREVLAGRRFVRTRTPRESIEKYLPWLLSAITIWMNVLAGEVVWYAWAVGLVGQAGWLVWIITTRNWGFLPMNIALWLVYGWNHLVWMRGL